MKTFHNIKCKAYTNDNFKPSKGIMRSRELSLTIPEETKVV